MREVDVSSMNVPIAEELNSDAGAKTSQVVMQFGAKIRDSKAHFKQIQHEAVGVKRDFEYEDNVSRPDASSIYGSLFRTMAPPYTSVPYIHNLFRKNIGPTVSDVNHRKQDVLIHPHQMLLSKPQVPWSEAVQQKPTYQPLAVFVAKSGCVCGALIVKLCWCAF